MSSKSTLSFKCALITGGGGGLGKTMAADLVKRGKKVIIAGRTQSKLVDAAKEIGATAHYVLDTGDIGSISPFIDRVIRDHPDLDCLINNAGVQRPFQILGPDYDFDLSSADQEIDINIRGPMHLTVGLVQRHFAKKGDGGVVMMVSSLLGFNPFSVINPVYNGTKAWVHMFCLNLRTQLAKANAPIKVVEIVPPTVETDLHRDRQDPDDNKKEHGAPALSIEDFMRDVGKGWDNSDDTIAPGMAADIVKSWDKAIGEKYQEQTS